MTYIKLVYARMFVLTICPLHWILKPQVKDLHIIFHLRIHSPSVLWITLLTRGDIITEFYTLNLSYRSKLILKAAVIRIFVQLKISICLGGTRRGLEDSPVFTVLKVMYVIFNLCKLWAFLCRRYKNRNDYRRYYFTIDSFLYCCVGGTRSSGRM